ncbi:MAG: hypothetical protein RSH52_26985, partial [Janthinobacterium sp.]
AAFLRAAFMCPGYHCIAMLLLSKSFNQSAILRAWRRDVAFSGAGATRATRTRQLVIISQLPE